MDSILFLSILKDTYEHFELYRPERAYMECTEFSFSVKHLAEKFKITEVSLVGAEVVSQHDFEDYEKDNIYDHAFLKIGNKFYDFTLSQFDPQKENPELARLPDYFIKIDENPNYPELSEYESKYLKYISEKFKISL